MGATRESRRRAARLSAAALVLFGGGALAAAGTSCLGGPRKLDLSVPRDLAAPTTVRVALETLAP